MLGYEDSDFVEVGELIGIEKVLSDFGNEMQQGLQNELSKKGKYGRSQVDSANLYQSIKFNAEIFGTLFTFQLSLADYYDYVNKGVKGTKSSKRAPNSPYRFGSKMPNPEGLKDWSYRRRLNPFAVAKSIQEKGTEGSGFYDKVVTKERLKQLTIDLQEAVKHDVQVLVTATAKGIIGKTK